jgi:glycosyltransferase involved in cell wall biosynthesis
MISILCPTRGRPQILQRMIESVRDTSLGTEIEVVLYIDDDDHSYDEMALPQGSGGAIAGTPTKVLRGKIVRGPRICMSDYWNELIPHAHGDIYMLCGDDCVFRTVGWDALVENAFAESQDKLLLCYGDDKGPGGRIFATHPFVHRRWVEIVGYFSGPGFSCDFADAWPQDVADMIGRKKFLPFVNEHMHALWGKALHDQTYRESAARKVRDKCAEKYDHTLELRKADAEKLRPFLNTPWIREEARINAFHS